MCDSVINGFLGIRCVYFSATIYNVVCNSWWKVEFLVHVVGLLYHYAALRRITRTSLRLLPKNSTFHYSWQKKLFWNHKSLDSNYNAVRLRPLVHRTYEYTKWLTIWVFTTIRLDLLCRKLPHDQRHCQIVSHTGF